LRMRFGLRGTAPSIACLNGDCSTSIDCNADCSTFSTQTGYNNAGASTHGYEDDPLPPPPPPTPNWIDGPIPESVIRESEELSVNLQLGLQVLHHHFQQTGMYSWAEWVRSDGNCGADSLTLLSLSRSLPSLTESLWLENRATWSLMFRLQLFSWLAKNELTIANDFMVTFQTLCTDERMDGETWSDYCDRMKQDTFGEAEWLTDTSLQAAAHLLEVDICVTTSHSANLFESKYKPPRKPSSSRHCFNLANTNNNHYWPISHTASPFQGAAVPAHPTSPTPAPTPSPTFDAINGGLGAASSETGFGVAYSGTTGFGASSSLGGASPSSVGGFGIGATAGPLTGRASTTSSTLTFGESIASFMTSASRWSAPAFGACDNTFGLLGASVSSPIPAPGPMPEAVATVDFHSLISARGFRHWARSGDRR